MNQHHLSKLDLFTPNALHPNLPPLTVGEYVCSGIDTTMISEPDVLARKEYIQGMLLDSTTRAMRRRVLAHTLLLKHMNPTIPAGYGRWVRVNEGVKEDARTESLRTPQSRAEYVSKTLKKEWAAMGASGYSTDTAIEVIGEGVSAT